MKLEKSLFEGIEDKKKRICEAAVEIFNRKNFNETTVSEIAKAARVGKGTFYLYFESKVSLYDFLLKVGVEKLISYVNDQIKEIDNPKDKLKELIRAQIGFNNSYKSYFSFFVSEMWVPREGLKEKIDTVKEDYISIIDEIIDEGKKEGLFKNINSDTIGSGLFGMVSVTSFHWIIYSDIFPKDDISSDLKEVFFNGLLKDN